MTDPVPSPGIPLAYAQFQTDGDRQLSAVRRTIFAAALFVAVFGFLPHIRLVGRGLPEGPATLAIWLYLFAYLFLAIGAFVGLLSFRVGKWQTIVSLVVISIMEVARFLFRTTQYGRLRLIPSRYLSYYLDYSLPTVWTLAFSIVAIVALSRRPDKAAR